MGGPPTDLETASKPENGPRMLTKLRVNLGLPIASMDE